MFCFFISFTASRFSKIWIWGWICIWIRIWIWIDTYLTYLHRSSSLDICFFGVKSTFSLQFKYTYLWLPFRTTLK